ncbi:MAG: hypothetical protein ABFC73_01850 [Clostridiaceae bacterium]
MSVDWELIDIKQLSRRIGEAYASFSESRISLSPTACEMVSDVYNKPYVQIRVARDDGGKARLVGLKFLKDKGENSLLVTRRKYKGDFVDGLNINSKSLVQIILGENFSGKTTRYEAEVNEDGLLVIDLGKVF